jgi:hypothetical protein
MPESPPERPARPKEGEERRTVRLSVGVPFLKASVESERILDLAGEYAAQARKHERQLERAASVTALLTGIVSGVIVSLAAGADDETRALGGGGAAFAAVALAASAIALLAALIQIVRTRRRKAQQSTPPPPNLTRLAMRLAEQRREVFQPAKRTARTADR